MEIREKVLFCIQVGLQISKYLEELERESIALWLIGFMLLPFVIGSLWSVGLAVIMQLFWLGLKSGILIVSVCSAYLIYLKFRRSIDWKRIRPLMGRRRIEDSREATSCSEELPCTLMDAVLSVFFQTGFQLPTFVWDAVIDVHDRNQIKVQTATRKTPRTESKRQPRVKPTVDFDTTYFSLVGTTPSDSLINELLNNPDAEDSRQLRKRRTSRKPEEDQAKPKKSTNKKSNQKV